MIQVHLKLRALPGHRDELLNALDGLELAAAADDTDVLELEVNVSAEDPQGVLVVTGWPSREHYERWQHDRDWSSIVAPLTPFLAGDPDVHMYRLADSIR